MIRSMTGYAQASADLPEARLTIEIRSLNHRFADLRLRLPSELTAGEREIRRRVLGRIKRGRVELSVTLDPSQGADPRPTFNRPLLEDVLAAAKAMGEEYQVAGRPKLSTLLAVPGMFRASAADLTWGEEQQGVLQKTLDAALDLHEEERRREGLHLQQELQARLARMNELSALVRTRASSLPPLLRDRLIERVGQLARDVEVDPARLAQEAAILADRSDVTEEIVRLEGHPLQASQLIGEPGGEPVGKRLEFLLQEIHRETNTINSKSPDLELSRSALALKAEIEKVREQIQNLE